jgi:aminocarboxymuconate-semialdehyde decarboxylase
MRAINSHFHWYPRSLFDDLCKRTEYPRAAPNKRGGYTLYVRDGATRSDTWDEWFELDRQLAHMDAAGREHGVTEFGVVCTLGPFGAYFSDVEPGHGLAAAQHYNEEMAGAMKRYPGKVWASGVVPLTDTKMAVDELDRMIGKLGLIGVNVPSSIGATGHIDHPRLEPFYARCEQLGVPIFLHPTDLAFKDILEGYDGALFASLGRVVEVSVAAYRLVLSGMMERHPNLKLYMSHTGGALPYQAGRMDKNSKAAKLPKPPSEYLRRFYTDTVSPHALGVKFAIDFYGVDHVMYGDDYPCWNPESALKVFQEVGLSAEDQQKIMYGNARRVLGLKDPVPAKKPATV